MTQAAEVAHKKMNISSIIKEETKRDTLEIAKRVFNRMVSEAETALELWDALDQFKKTEGFSEHMNEIEFSRDVPIDEGTSKGKRKKTPELKVSEIKPLVMKALDESPNVKLDVKDLKKFFEKKNYKEPVDGRRLAKFMNGLAENGEVVVKDNRYMKNTK